MSSVGLTIVTGASSGIGRALAKRIAAVDGAPIAALARRKELLDSLVEEIERAGGRAIAIRCDVTDRAQVEAAVRAAESAFGPTARLVANAGGSPKGGAGDFDAERVRQALDLNVMGVAHCVAAVLPGMLERRSGHIIAISSLAAYRGLPGAASYSAAKGALTNLIEGLRVDLRGSGVDVSVIAPGFVRTKTDGAKRKKNRPFRMELDPAVERIHGAIQRRQPYYAFPKTLLALVWLGWMVPAPLFDRVVGGRGPKAR